MIHDASCADMATAHGATSGKTTTMAKIRIADLDLGLQTRTGTDAETINNYAEAMADGATFPDVTVFTDGERYWLADGFHRVMAAKQNGKATIPADVRKGTADDAVVFGGTANNKQGKRPTRADVQHFMQMVWERREAIFGGTPTGGNMAKKCGVSRPTGERFVQERLAEMPNAPTRPTVKKIQSNMPMRPTKLIGANSREYPVRPTPKMPSRVAAASPEVPQKHQQNGPEPCAAVPQSTVPARSVRRMPTDRYGVEIPVEINAAFEGGALSDLLAMVRRARAALRKAFEDALPQFAAVRQDALMQLNNAYVFISAAEPHCVCRMCQGTGCKACHERGWQTEEEYRRNPKEFLA